MRNSVDDKGGAAMNILRSIVMAFSMFSRIPMPTVEWKKENMQYMLAVFPLVGCILAGLLFCWHLLSNFLSISSVLFAVGMTVIPILYTGGVHLDGFCDTVDALSSHGDIEKRRSILKDPHTGAFAVIFVCVYFLASFGLYSELIRNTESVLLICTIPVISRTLSGIAGICFPVYGEQGLLAAFNKSANKLPALIILCVWFAACSSAMVIINLFCGIAMIAVSICCTVCIYRISSKQFGGMSGDLSGFFLQYSELALLAVIIVFQKVGLL